MSLFRSYAKFKIGQRIFRAVRDMMRGRGATSGAGRRRTRV
jgi:hypothetical protein